MTIQVQVSDVDGVSFITKVTPSLTEALAFLKREDHEGSALSLIVTTHDEGVYAVLKALAVEQAEGQR